MKKGRFLAVGLIAGVGLGWALGYLRLPLITQNQGFWVGLLSGSLMVCLIVWGWSFRNKKNRPGQTSLVLVSILLLGSTLGGLLLTSNVKSIREANLVRETQLVRDSIHLVANQQVQKAEAMLPILEQLHQQLIQGSDRRLSDSDIQQLKAISLEFEPYPELLEGSDSVLLISPQRSQLFLIVRQWGIDSSSFVRLKEEVPFTHADFRHEDLSGVDFSYADLRNAHFQDGILAGAIFRECDLRGADFTRATLNQVEISESVCKRMVFQHTEANHMTLNNSQIDGALLQNSSMNQLTMNETIFRWGSLDGSILTNGEIHDTDLKRTTMRKTNFARTDMAYSNVWKSVFEQTNFTETNLQGVSVGTDQWIDQLPGWKVLGAAVIEEAYTLIPDTIPRYKDSKFLLERADLSQP